MEVCRSVVHDHPGDMKWMYRLAMVLDMHCYSWGNKDRYDSGRAEAIRYYSTVIEHTDDATLRENAVAAIVQALSYSGRKEEARKYIDLYPKERQGDLLGYCLEGDEKIAHRQRKIKRAFENFISLLSFYDPYEVQLMGELIKTVIPDGNYLDDLYCMYCYEMGRAKKAVEENRSDDAVQSLVNAKTYAVAKDRIEYDEPGEYRYTAPLFDKIVTDTRTHLHTNDRPVLPAFIKILQEADIYSPLRDREDFKALFEE